MKLVLTLILVATFGSSVADEKARINEELRNIIVKYEFSARGNSEFSGYLDRVREASRSKDIFRKELEVRRFKEYDVVRQEKEDMLQNRINEVNALLDHDKKMGRKCVSFYNTQIKKFREAIQYSNGEKQRVLDTNREKCYKVKRKETDYFDYLDYYNYDWLF